MATSVARKAAPARRSPAARRPKAAAPKEPATKRRATEAAAPLHPAKAASEPPTNAKPNGQAEPKRAKAQDAAEPKKLKLVRDTFTLPKVEYGVIDVLKTRAARLGRPAKKSEIVRAGVKALAEMDDAQFLACVSMLPVAKPSRSKP